ncbi:MAG TPA: PrsW family glutamic-type intramembrane protease [Acidocella sp.]|jgi:RsiW-degrading membrane proteinase PrsW (M82 family)|nr:PrsW family glutamic-type intramembrane protease [Acidocella sp.]
MISFFIAVLPALFMWEFAAIKVNFRLPKTARKRLFRLGGRFALLALVIELCEGLVPLKGLSPVAHALVQALFIAAVPEELVKFAAVNKFGRKELDELGPGVAILLAVGASLGFAVLETKLYVLGGGLGSWVVRALSATPMHAIFGFVMGSFMVLAWRDPLRFDERMLTLALVVPIIFHATYDFLLMLHDFNPALHWPLALEPLVMLVEGLFALILTNHAVNGATAIYGRTVPADPRGHRALGLACVTLLLLFACLWAGEALHGVRAFAMLAAMPTVLTLDLGLLAYVRSRSWI